MSKQRPPGYPDAPGWPPAAEGPPTTRYPHGYQPPDSGELAAPSAVPPPPVTPPVSAPTGWDTTRVIPQSQAPSSDFERTIAQSDLGQRTISIASPLGHTQLLHPEMAPGPDSGARLVASQASTQAVYGAELHPQAPEWMRMGRLLALQIEDAIARGQGDATTQAAITRAWYAWQLGGYSAQQLKDVATNLMRAYKMARQAPSEHRDAVVNDSAGVVYSTLPPVVREHCDRTRVLIALQLMMEYEDPRSARFEGLAVVLSWTDQARSLGKQALAAVLGEG
ncbi:MAG: hypothetical protein KIT72_08710 [Polyangiaceae bacterium]|nr:hypothetical protein [Polyangiaceae bacterium]MCW5790489.1 hypothetical protein [Polyangiaceae bacterium]